VAAAAAAKAAAPPAPVSRAHWACPETRPPRASSSAAAAAGPVAAAAAEAKAAALVAVAQVWHPDPVQHGCTARLFCLAPAAAASCVGSLKLLCSHPAFTHHMLDAIQDACQWHRSRHPP